MSDLREHVLARDTLEVFNTDDPEDMQKLRERSSTGFMNEVLMRDWDRDGQSYNSTQWLRKYGVPSYDQADYGSTFDLLPEREWKEALEYTHEHEMQPVYGTYKWRPKGKKYNQDGIGYCWTWSGTGALMTRRAMEDKDLVLLAPVSMGFLVNWRDEGNYLDSLVQGGRNRGFCPIPDQNNWEGVNSLKRSASYWQDYEAERAKYQIGNTISLDPNRMQQMCVSAIVQGYSLYIAYMWWGHAVELVGYRYNGNTLETLISNSHNESDMIVLTGSKAVPYEAIAYTSTVLTESSSLEHKAQYELDMQLAF